MFTVGTGMCNGWAARYLSPNGERRITGSSGHGSLDGALPPVVGAQFTDRNRQVVPGPGDGGFSMPRGDFLTLVQYGLPLKMVLFTSSSLGKAAWEVPVSGLPSCGTTDKTPGFAPLARAVGAQRVRVEKPQQLTRALRDVLRHPGPVPADGGTDPAALSLPPKTGAVTVTGFAWSDSKIEWGGEAGRMIRMARSGLRNVPRP